MVLKTEKKLNTSKVIYPSLFLSQSINQSKILYNVFLKDNIMCTLSQHEIFLKTQCASFVLLTTLSCLQKGRKPLNQAKLMQNNKLHPIKFNESTRLLSSFVSLPQPIFLHMIVLFSSFFSFGRVKL